MKAKRKPTNEQAKQRIQTIFYCSLDRITKLLFGKHAIKDEEAEY